MKKKIYNFIGLVVIACLAGSVVYFSIGRSNDSIMTDAEITEEWISFSNNNSAVNFDIPIEWTTSVNAKQKINTYDYDYGSKIDLYKGDFEFGNNGYVVYDKLTGWQLYYITFTDTGYQPLDNPSILNLYNLPLELNIAKDAEIAARMYDTRELTGGNAFSYFIVFATEDSLHKIEFPSVAGSRVTTSPDIDRLISSITVNDL